MNDNFFENIAPLSENYLTGLPCQKSPQKRQVELIYIGGIILLSVLTFWSSFSG